MIILNIWEEVERVSCWTPLAVFFGIIAIICISVLICSYMLDSEEVVAISCFVGIISFVIMSILQSNGIATTKTYMEVLLDDSVSFREIVDQYEVVERRGQIFVLKEKSDN